MHGLADNEEKAPRQTGNLSNDSAEGSQPTADNARSAIYLLMPSGPKPTPIGLFVVLALLVLVLSVDVFGFLGVGDPKESNAMDVAPSTMAAWKALDADGRQLLD